MATSFQLSFGLPITIARPFNNYGPRQHPEKLIPKMIYNIINNKPLPLYGNGKNSREWIYVKDHCEALLKIFQKGKVGEFYNIGSNFNLNNIQICKTLMKISKETLKDKHNIEIWDKVKNRLRKEDEFDKEKHRCLDENEQQGLAGISLSWLPQDS